MTASTTSIFRWAARGLASIFALFLSIFAVDAFGEGYSFFDTILALLIHLIPTLIIASTIILAWKKELIGAIVFTTLSVAYGAGTVGRGMTDWWVAIGSPMMLMGILYFISWRGGKQVTA